MGKMDVVLEFQDHVHFYLPFISLTFFSPNITPTVRLADRPNQSCVAAIPIGSTPVRHLVPPGPQGIVQIDSILPELQVAVGDVPIPEVM